MNTTKLVVIFFSLIPHHAFGWGAIGHRMVSETAAILLANQHPEVKSTFTKARFALGVNSTLPDSRFREFDDSSKKEEPPTHFMDLDLVEELWGTNAVHEIPLVYESFKTDLTSKAKKAKWEDSKITSLGTSPWRIDQFLKRGKEALQEAPNDSAFYELGVMAHYSGDAAMPLHASSNYDGQKTHQKGIHAYFETSCVEALEPGLSAPVLASAQAHQKEWIQKWKKSLGGAERETSIGMSIAVLKDSELAIPQLLKIDLEITSGKERKQPDQGCPAFQNLLIEQLAKGAVLTAYLWEMALPDPKNWKSGKESHFINPWYPKSYPEPKY